MLCVLQLVQVDKAQQAEKDARAAAKKLLVAHFAAVSAATAEEEVDGDESLERMMEELMSDNEPDDAAAASAAAAPHEAAHLEHVSDMTHPEHVSVDAQAVADVWQASATRGIELMNMATLQRRGAGGLLVNLPDTRNLSLLSIPGSGVVFVLSGTGAAIIHVP